MIELSGLIYGAGKDIIGFLKWKEETKFVDREWLEKSGFGKKMESQGYKLCWSRPEKIETRMLYGYEFVFEIDKIKRIRRRIERSGDRDSLVLLRKKNT